MINFITNSAVIREDVDRILSANLPWDQLSGKTVAITGAAGMLAAYVVETLLSIGKINVIALVRNVEKARKRFSCYLNNRYLSIINYESSMPLQGLGKINYIIHAASLPHSDTNTPVDVLVPNVIGTYQLLDFARKQDGFEKFLYLSSGAVYGNDDTSNIEFVEDKPVSINPSDVSNCYAIGKCTGEALCAAYTRQYNISTKILRYGHTFGPGLNINNDIRAFAEFLRNAILGEDIKLITSGKQKRYYCYISDATTALFRILFSNDGNNTYNVINANESHSILEFALEVAKQSPNKISVSFCNGLDRNTGYVPLANAARMNSNRLFGLGWMPNVSLGEGIRRTLNVYSSM